VNAIRTTGDYARLFALAAALGVVGGLANELLHSVRGRNGNLRMPKYQRSKGLLYLGFVGPIILGAVAAVVVLVFLPTSEESRPGPGGTTVMVRTYDLLRVVPLSLAAGVGGSAVLTAAQARLVAMVNQQKADFLQATVSSSLDRAAAQASDEAGKVVAGKVQEIKPKVERLVEQARAQVPAEVVDAMKKVGAPVPKSGVTFSGREVVSPQAVDALFDQVAEEASAAVKATIAQQTAAEKAAILDVARSFDEG